jgi:hypothetical protein
MLTADRHFPKGNESMKRIRSFAGLCLTFALVAGGQTASAQTVAYQAFGTGSFSPASGDYGGAGLGTHLGKQTYAGNVAVFPTAHPLVFDWALTAPQESVSADGDKVFFAAFGTVELIPLDATFTVFSAVWTGDFIVVGGTGRFANVQPADEPLAIVAVNDPFLLTDPVWTFAWTLEGEIRLR